MRNIKKWKWDIGNRVIYLRIVIYGVVFQNYNLTYTLTEPNHGRKHAKKTDFEYFFVFITSLGPILIC